MTWDEPEGSLLEVIEMIWSLNKLADPVGATWGPGGLRAPTRTYWGWNANGAKKIALPKDWEQKLAGVSGRNAQAS